MRERQERWQEALQPGIMTHGTELCYDQRLRLAKPNPRALEDRKRDMPMNEIDLTG
jgi:hypothetical protein